MEAKEKFEALEKLGAQFNTVLAGFAKENGFENGKVDKSSLETDKLEKMKADIMARMDVLNPPKKKFVFGGTEELKDNEMRKSFGDWLLMAKYNHPSLAGRFEKTVMSEGDNAQGGYLVPTGFDTNIIGELNQATSIIPKCTAYPHAQSDGFTKNLPKWLTDMTVYWVAEAARKTASKPTLTKIQSILKKVCALVTFTDEELADNTCGLSGKIQTLVGENFASELERIILVGDVAGAGDPFNGIYNSTPSTVPQAGVSLAYSDLTKIFNNPNVNDKYNIKPEWYLNKTVLGLVMDLVDANGRPLWNMGNLAGGIPATIFGYPYNKSQHIPNTLGTDGDASTIIFGDYKWVLVGEKAGNAGISVAITNSAVISDANGVVTENAFTQNETFYRFELRKSVVVAIPPAFSVGTGIK